MGHGRRGLSAWPFGLVAAVIAVGGAGCASDGDSPAPAPPLAGGWVLQSGGCEQRLLFEPGGGFRASLRVGIGQNGLTHTVAGTALATPLPAGGGYTLRIFPTAPQDSTALAYCSQWWQRAEVALPFAQIAAANGFDPRQLHLRTEVSPTLGPFLVGTDASRTDRLALLVNPGAGTLTGIPLEAGVISPAPLFHALPADDAAALQPVGGVPVLNLPYRAFRQRFAGGDTEFKLLLNFTSALEVVFSGFGDGGVPACDFSTFQNLDFLTGRTDYDFSSGPATITFFLNPNEAGTGFVQFPVGQTVAFLLPLSITIPQNATCTFNIRARDMVTRLLEGRGEQIQALSLFSLPLAGPAPAIATASAAGRLNLGRLPPSIVVADARLLAAEISLPPFGVNPLAASFDYLNLLQPGARQVFATPQWGPFGPYLNLFSTTQAQGGLGPFLAHQRPAGEAVPGLPAAVSGTFGGLPEQRSYRFTVGAPTRVALWSEGGVATSAVLHDAGGVEWARNAAGAADGAGFRIVRSLAAGEYDLSVRFSGAPGPFTLRFVPGAVYAIADDGLLACAIEAGLARGASLRLLTCPGRGISSLAGIESLSGLRVLDVSRNRISDVTPLQTLAGLRELSLDGNAVSDLAPLAALANLARLSLANNPLTAATVTQLLEFGARLTHLDLTGVAGLEQEQVDKLKANFPNTVIITPAGAVVE